MSVTLHEQTPIVGHPPPGPWPRKVNLFGVEVSATTYAEALQAIFDAVSENRSGIVSAQANYTPDLSNSS